MKSQIEPNQILNMLPHNGSYRTDIDGIRAIAVLLVVIYHAFPSYLPGGFIGVDIFFVISGYLITSIIFKDLGTHNFSFSKFYSRRIRRIFPSLIVVLIATTISGWLFLFPNEFKSLGKHIGSATVFTSNLLSWHESGYFDPVAETKPLLHLWSLGIEEQFYIAWPFIAWLAWKFKSHLTFFIIVCVMFSFALNVSMIEKHTIATFYSPGTRAWELMAGSLLAARQIKQTSFSSVLNKIKSLYPNYKNTLPVIGLVMIFTAIFLIDKTKQFPGYWALLPTVGTLLILAQSSRYSLVNQYVLSHPWMVSVGLISYPLYLWHWPLLSYLNILEPNSTSDLTKVSLLALSFFLAWATYRFIERPIRSGRHIYIKVKIISLVVIMIIIGVTGLSIAKNLIPARMEFNRNILTVLKSTKDSEFPGNGTYIKGASSDEVVFIGDSFMEHYYSRFKYLTQLKNGTYSIRFAGVGGCPPLPKISRIADPGSCSKYNGKAYAIAREPNVKAVVFGSAWHYFYPITQRNKAYTPDRFEHDAMLFQDKYSSRYPIYVGSRAFNEVFADFESIVAELISQGKDVYFVLPTPLDDQLDPSLMINRFTAKLNIDLKTAGIAKQKYLADFAPLIKKLDDIANRTGAKIIDPADNLCRENFCPAFEGSEPIYRDAGHLRPFFVRNRVTDFDKYLLLHN